MSTYNPDTLDTYRAAGIADLGERLPVQHHGMSTEHGFLVGYVFLVRQPSGADPAEVFVTSPHDSELEAIGHGWNVVIDNVDGQPMIQHEDVDVHAVRPLVRGIIAELLEREA